MNRRIHRIDKHTLAVRGQTRPISIPVLQQRPEILFVPLAGSCFLLSLAPFAYGWQWGQNFVHYLVVPTANQISPVTWSASWLSFGSAFLLMYTRTRLNALRCAMVAASIPFGATGLFEIVFQAIGVTIRPLGFYMGPYDWFAISLWTAIGITGLPFWKITWMFWLSIAGIIIGFWAWILIGYPQVTRGTIESVQLAYVFNGFLKVMTFVLFTLPMLQGIHTSWVAKPHGPNLNSATDGSRLPR